MSLRALFLIATLGGATGCVSVGTTRHGNPIPWPAVEAIEPGQTTLADALALLGAPDVMQRHPDGTMLMWRARRHDYNRLGIEPDRLVSFIPANRFVAAALSNLSLVVEDAVESEDRVALLINDDAVVEGLGIHRGQPR